MKTHPQQLAVRLARPEDCEGIARVKVDAWRTAYAHFMDAQVLEGLDLSREGHRWRERLDRPEDDQPVWTAHLSDEVAGFLVAGANRFPEVPADAEVHALYVHPEAQRKGVGRALLKEAVRWLSAKGYRSLVVFAFRDNRIGCSFYESLGAKLYDTGEYEVSGRKYPDVSYLWGSISDLERSLA